MSDQLGGQNLLNTDKQAASWQLNALTEALSDLTLTVSDSLSVGRGSDNDVVLGSKEISRNHALLSVLNGQLYVKDLASSNGTFVNDERIESNKSKSLQVNDTLGFASFSFEVMVPESSEANKVYVDTNTGTVTDTYSDIEKLSAGTASNPVAEFISTSPVEPIVVEETVAEHNTLTTEAAEPIDQQSQPVVKPTIIEEVLSSSDSDNTVDSNSVIDDELNDSKPNDSGLSNRAAAMPIAATPVKESTTSTSMPSKATEKETVMSSEIPKQPLAEELPVKQPIANEPVTNAPVTDEPLMHDRASHQESVVSPEHDKTTKTALQEEADPDVLRAKQAATAQFSGTANLGTGRDLGTEGNNAMDQAVDNPANAGHPDKKPSGGWFIWVFIAIIIIGLALWLFNMGGA